MELHEYSTEELKAELKRRADKKKEAKTRVPRCRNCKHCVHHHIEWLNSWQCEVNTYVLRGYTMKKVVSLSKRACEHWERKEEKQWD